MAQERLEIDMMNQHFLVHTVASQEKVKNSAKRI